VYQTRGGRSSVRGGSECTSAWLCNMVTIAHSLRVFMVYHQSKPFSNHSVPKSWVNANVVIPGCLIRSPRYSSLARESRLRPPVLLSAGTALTLMAWILVFGSGPDTRVKCRVASCYPGQPQTHHLPALLSFYHFFTLLFTAFDLSLFHSYLLPGKQVASRYFFPRLPQFCCIAVKI